MNKCILYLAGLLFLSSVLPLDGQKLIKNSSVTGVCYAGNKINRIYIPPPDAFFKKSSKSGGSITIYYSGFPVQAKVAVEYARSILETLLPADTKMTILASWEKISTAGVLANTVITGYAGGWSIDALNPLAYYPIALAEKIAGESLNLDLQGDMELRINNSYNWYLGTDGKPDTRYDLVTVAIHEICHGLGFFDSMNTNATTGYYGINKIPMIYDTFIENVDNKKLTDTLMFLNPSASLRTELTGGRLWFNGPVVRSRSSVSRVPLYVPFVWDPGSSISHLDETPKPDINALMTPIIDKGEAIHNPGKLTFSILGDLGWINTRVLHKPMGDTEENKTVVPLSIFIKSDTLYNRDKVGVVFSFDNFVSDDTLYMISPGSDNTFIASLNIPSYNTDLQYYFFVEDAMRRLYNFPSYSKIFRYSAYIGTDTVKPVISHVPADYYLETVDIIDLKASVRDNLGLDTVYIEYKLNDGIPIFKGMIGNNGSFSFSLNTGSLNLKGGDSLKYRIFAFDSAQVTNSSVLPGTGYFSVGIEDISDVVESYATDFTNAEADFFRKGFEILKPVNFSSFGLHTTHPYISPEDNNKSIESVAMLRHPLKLKESGLLIRFNEVVLVEPGEDGSVFGSEGFYDYVIVDGSKDFGETWFNLTDGYDSRLVAAWETAYNNSVTGQNSTYSGNESMLKKHTIYYRPAENVIAGDTLLIRFRLYSDPFANGWGWVIEDLKINPLIDAIEKTETAEILAYPNPGKGRINLSTDALGNSNGKPVKYSVFNSSGICLIKSQTLGDSQIIDISNYRTGMYIIVLYRDDGIKTIKYSLIR